jgi:hypothetical protein
MLVETYAKFGSILKVSQKLLLEVHHEKGSSKVDYVIFKMISIPPFKILIDKNKLIELKNIYLKSAIFFN